MCAPVCSLYRLASERACFALHRRRLGARMGGNSLDMSRIDSGGLPPAREWEELGDIVGAVLARMRPQLHGRTVKVDLLADLPLIWANAALIDQVLTNLLSNALKYTPAQTP